MKLGGSTEPSPGVKIKITNDVLFLKDVADNAADDAETLVLLMILDISDIDYKAAECFDDADWT